MILIIIFLKMYLYFFDDYYFYVYIHYQKNNKISPFTFFDKKINNFKKESLKN